MSITKRTVREQTIIEVRRALRSVLRTWEGVPFTVDERARLLDHLMNEYVLPSPSLHEPEDVPSLAAS